MPPSDAVAALTPALAVGERVSLRVNDGAGRREVIGFVTRLSDASVSVVDRRGVEHALSREAVEAARRVGVALGRRPDATPRDLLDALAARAGASGTPWLGRISVVLEGRTPPASVPAWGEWAEVFGVRARFEGEWVTLPWSGADAVLAACWWATRMGARSVQVLAGPGADADALRAAGLRPARSPDPGSR